MLSTEGENGIFPGLASWETEVDTHLPVLAGRAAHGDRLIAVASSLQA